MAMRTAAVHAYCGCTYQVNQSGSEHVSGVERIVTQSPHQRRNPNQMPSPGMVRAETQGCAGAGCVRTVISPPPPPSLLPGMMRAQPHHAGDGASSSEVQSGLERAPPLGASGAAASGAAASGAAASGAAASGAVASGRLSSSKYARARLVGAATIRSRGLCTAPPSCVVPLRAPLLRVRGGGCTRVLPRPAVPKLTRNPASTGTRPPASRPAGCTNRSRAPAHPAEPTHRPDVGTRARRSSGRARRLRRHPHRRQRPPALTAMYLVTSERVVGFCVLCV